MIDASVDHPFGYNYTIMGLLLIIVGLLLWLLAGWSLVGLILIVVGLVLIFVPGAPYGYSSWRGRGAPPP